MKDISVELNGIQVQVIGGAFSMRGRRSADFERESHVPPTFRTSMDDDLKSALVAFVTLMLESEE